MKSEKEIRSRLEHFNDRLYNSDEELICYMDKGWKHALQWVLGD